MRLKNLTKCFIYTQEVVNQDGEKTKKWKYKKTLLLNVQQDINELDINSAGIIDYDKLKIRTDYETGLEKNNGVSLTELQLVNQYTTSAPRYIVISNPKVGKTTNFVCERYHGE